MNEKQIKKLIQDEIKSNQQLTQFSVTPISFHKHNGIDSSKISQKDILNGTNAIAPLNSINSETVTLNTLQNTTQVHLHAIAYSSLSRFQLTTAIGGGATSATLAANWPYATGTYTIYFSNGQSKSVTLTNASVAVSWVGGLTGYGVFPYIDTAISFSFDFSAPPTAGLLSKTLTGAWSYPTGEYTVTFSTGETKLVPFVNGYNVAFWNSALGADASATAKASLITRKSTVNGFGQLGNCYRYNFPSNITNVPTRGGDYEPFLQSSNAIYVDTNNLLNTKVSASGDSKSVQGSILYVADEYGVVVASILLTQWLGNAITFKVSLATGWQIKYYLSMS